MSQIYDRARPIFYLVTVSPVLTPGVIIGISTVIFWKDFSEMTDCTKSFFYKGVILSIFGQSSFVAAYCLLIIMARLQRFDRAQEEAALDLGASYPQVFWHILLPFLKPALVLGRRHRLSVVVRKLQHDDLRHPRRQDAGHGSGGPGAAGHDAGFVGAGGHHHRHLAGGRHRLRGARSVARKRPPQQPRSAPRSPSVAN